VNPLESLLPVVRHPVSVGGTGPIGLVIVDPGVGFTRTGALSDVAQMQPMLQAIAAEYRALRAAVGDRLHVLVFLDSHHRDIPEPPYPPHCIEGTGEELIDPELEWLLAEPRLTVIRKDCINGFVGSIDRKTGANAFCRWVASNAFEKLLVTGDCTDICVSDFVVTALSARNHGLLTAFDPDADRVAYVRAITGLAIVVLPGACATFQAPGHDAIAAHHVGLWLMAARGAIVASEWSL
jgi:nicotinamidase-related amidase